MTATADRITPELAAQYTKTISGPVPEDGATVLNDTRAFLHRFTAFPGDAEEIAVVLWAAHTWVYEVFSISPRLALNSSEPASGKTRVLDMLTLLCANPRLELDPTGPALAVMINQLKPTILMDEVDTVFGARGSSSAKRQLRGILNSGYKAGAKLTRRNKNDFVEDVVFCPVAFAGLGHLPDTLRSRSAEIIMRKRRPEQQIEPYFPRMHEPTGKAIGEAMGKWARSKVLELATAWPELPEGIEDRAAELCSTLLAIADSAGGDWPELGRMACRALFLRQDDSPKPPPASRLLTDMAAIWPLDDQGAPDRNVATADLLARLFALDAAPWRALWDPVAAPRELAALLGSRGITPRKVRIGDLTLQGYRLADLQPHTAIPPATDGQDGAGNVPPVPGVPPVPASVQS